jgi:hypothetical protein
MPEAAHELNTKTLRAGIDLKLTPTSFTFTLPPPGVSGVQRHKVKKTFLSPQ